MSALTLHPLSPEPILRAGASAELVATVLRLSPSLQITFLADLGTRIHASTVRATFSSLSIPDDDVLLCEHGRFTKSMVHSLFSNPGRYASIVKSLVIRDPKTACERIPDGTTMCNDTNDLLYDPQGSRVICPIASTSLASLLKICCNLEEFIWEGTLPPPDGVCEVCNHCHADALQNFIFNVDCSCWSSTTPDSQYLRIYLMVSSHRCDPLTPRNGVYHRYLSFAMYL